MWLVFLIAALLMLVGGVGGSYIVKMRPEMVPPEAFQYLPLAENIAYSVGIAMCLLGVSLCYRKLRWVGRRRSGSGRSGRTRAIDFPKRNREAVAELEPMPDDAPPSEQPTLLFSDPGGGDDEPGTRKMRKIGRR
ncbi:MAG: hypothetical protein ACYTKD_02050 [Planctomycetota bacterium]|jgi:hypothetical protein